MPFGLETVGRRDAILTRAISPIFDQLEDENPRKNLVRVHQAIAADLTSVVAFTGDWAGWDESYRFVQDENEEFIAGNLDQTSLSILGVNLILYFDDYDSLVWSSMVATGMGSDPVVAATIARSIRQR